MTTKRKYRLKYFVLILVLFLINIGIEAQSSLEVIGTVEKDMEPLSNAKVTLYKGGSAIQTVSTSDRGDFRLNLEMNSEYIIEIAKSGLLTKKIAFVTDIPGEISGKWTMEFAMSLFPGCEGVNTSALNEPVDRIKYSSNKADFISDETYVQNMRGRIEKLLSDIDRCQADKYQDAMSEGNKLLEQKKFDEAREKFLEAQEVYPDDKLAQRKAAEAEKGGGMSQLNESAYNSTITEADRLFAEKKYDAAMAKYNEALRKKQDSYAQNRISEINTILNQQKQGELAKQQQNDAEQQALLKSYNEALAMGQSALQAKDYEAARQHFNRAQMMRPEESLPRQKIGEIDKQINDQRVANEQAKKASALQKVEQALDEGDKMLAQNNYDGAEAAYQRAIALDPNDTYAKQQLKKVQTLQLNAAAEKQKALDKSYSSAVDRGDQLLAAASYEQAVDAYKQALLQKPNDPAAMSKLQAAEQRLASERQKQAGEQARKQEYDNHLAQANKYFDTKQYAQAKQSYQSALNLYPTQSYPRTRIDEIDRLLGEQQKSEQYSQIILRADGLMASKSYDAAKTVYQQAQALKPAEAYPRQKITEIDGIIMENARLQSQQKQRDADYTRAVQEADNLLASNRLPEAKTAYQRALTLKPAESYPQQQITKIDGMIAGQLQKENEAKAREQQYNELITRANGQFTGKDYMMAKTTYQQALAMKGTDPYPKQRIAEIDQILQQQMQQEQQKAAQQKMIDQQYALVLKEADDLFNASKLEQAKSAYQRALGIKASEAYPKLQITKIDGIIAEQLRRENEQKMAQDQQYSSLITRADGLFNGKDYVQAKSAYQQALAIKGTEAYPRQRITEIDQIMQQQQQQAAQQKLSDQQYAQAVKEADNLFNAVKLPEAKSAYQRALGIKAAETYPQQQIARIDGIMAEQAKKENEQRLREQQYTQAVAQADQAYGLNKLEEAKTGYQRALSFKPAESYPASQISKIDQQLAALDRELQSKAAFEQKYNSFIISGDRAFDGRDYPAAKTAYNEALKLKPAEKYPQDRLNKIAEFERILAVQEANRKTSTTTTTTTSASQTTSAAPKKLSELNFADESERQKYLNSLRGHYPAGVTLEVYKEKTLTTSRYVIIRGDEVNEFRMVKYNYGDVEYSQNGIPTTGMYFDQQVKTRPGEFFQQFNF